MWDNFNNKNIFLRQIVRFMKIRKIILYYCLLIGLWVSYSYCLENSDIQLLKNIEQNLNRIQTLKSDFVQISYIKEKVIRQKGIFYLTLLPKASLQLRIEYDLPSHTLILASGHHSIFYDFEVDQKSAFDLRKTPAIFFTKRPFNFQSYYIVTDFKKTSQDISFKIAPKKDTSPISSDKDFKSIILTFNRHNFSLKSWEIEDFKGVRTHFLLTNVVFNQKINPNIFKFWSPEAKTKGPVRRTRK